MKRWDLWYRSQGDVVLFVQTDAAWWVRLCEWLQGHCLPEITIPLVGRIIVNRNDPEWRCTLAEWFGDGHRVTLDDLWHLLWMELDVLNRVHSSRTHEVPVLRQVYLDAMGEHAEQWIKDCEPYIEEAKP